MSGRFLKNVRLPLVQAGGHRKAREANAGGARSSLPKPLKHATTRSPNGQPSVPCASDGMHESTRKGMDIGSDARDSARPASRRTHVAVPATGSLSIYIGSVCFCHHGVCSKPSRAVARQHHHLLGGGQQQCGIARRRPDDVHNRRDRMSGAVHGLERRYQMPTDTVRKYLFNHMHFARPRVRKEAVLP